MDGMMGDSRRDGGARRSRGLFRVVMLVACVLGVLAWGARTPMLAGPEEAPKGIGGTPKEMDALFRRVVEGRDGCCVVMDARTGQVLFEAGAARCRTRFSPCSTFKLPLALIAFDQKVIGLDSRFKWDGKIHEYPGWNQDQTTASWMRESVVWVSQGLTHRLGRGTLERYLDRFGYGNRDMSSGLDRAWIGGSLRISALEQAGFLARLWTGRLPLPAGVVDPVEGLLLRDDFPSGAVVRGKTGTGIHLCDASGRVLRDRQLGWFVGCVRKGGRTVVFAMNITDVQTTRPAGPVARGLAKQLLVELGLL